MARVEIKNNEVYFIFKNQDVSFDEKKVAVINELLRMYHFEDNEEIKKYLKCRLRTTFFNNLEKKTCKNKTLLVEPNFLTNGYQKKERGKKMRN